MKITHKTFDGLSLVIIEGTLNSTADTAINEILMNTPETEANHLWIDCSNMREIIKMNSSLSDFINYLLQLKKQGTQVLLYGVDAQTKRILQLLKLDDVFRQVNTLDDAYLTLSHTLTTT